MMMEQLPVLPVTLLDVIEHLNLPWCFLKFKSAYLCRLGSTLSTKTARSGLHILLGGVCALTVVVFFRFFVLTRIRYGPARYWAILFVFWFLVFGIWASRTHDAHSA
nr:RING/FYVE/PHD zinc finger protein [Ipomoea batatas]